MFEREKKKERVKCTIWSQIFIFIFMVPINSKKTKFFLFLLDLLLLFKRRIENNNSNNNTFIDEKNSNRALFF